MLITTDESFRYEWNSPLESWGKARLMFFALAVLEVQLVGL